MNHYIKIFLITLLFANANAGELYDDAINRGIDETCSTYLSQIEKSYKLQGLNLTFAHPKEPSLFPSLHISSQQYNNGASIFSATLIPDGNYCYLSTVNVTSVNNQSCAEITQIKTNNDPELIISNYADGAFSIISSKNNDYQLVLTKTGDIACTITETRMLWPGS